MKRPQRYAVNCHDERGWPAFLFVHAANWLEALRLARIAVAERTGWTFEGERPYVVEGV